MVSNLSIFPPLIRFLLARKSLQRFFMQKCKPLADYFWYNGFFVVYYK